MESNFTTREREIVLDEIRGFAAGDMNLFSRDRWRTNFVLWRDGKPCRFSAGEVEALRSAVSAQIWNDEDAQDALLAKIENLGDAHCD